MKNMMCSRCHKRPAILFMSRFENGETINEGFCLQCAKELGIPQVKDLIDKMGITDEEIEAMSNQFMEYMNGDDENGFELGGAMPFPMMPGMFGGLTQQEGEELASYEEEPTADGEAPHKSTERRKLKYLDNYCENLNRKVEEGRVDNIVGRDREIYRVLQILNRRTKNNPCLIGEPGVGKTAIAEGIAQRVVEGKVPPSLMDKQIYLLDLTALVAGTQFRGQFESRVKGLVEDVKKAGNVILFIDEIHNLVGAGDSEGSMNAANILKPALSRGEIQVIGATTFAEYRKHIEKDAALERRFQPVTVNEPSIEESIAVLQGIKKYYEAYHRVKVSDDIIRRCVVMAERYVNDRFLPDKAIDLMDEACSCCNLDNEGLAEYDKLSRRLQALQGEESALAQGADVDYEKLAGLRSEQLRLQEQLREMEPTVLGAEVTVDHLAKVVELWTGIPATKIKETELARVAGLEAALGAKVIGQEEAVSLVAAAIRRSRVQISPRRRPASFIFVGPTGVGKTELVKVLAEELFDTADPLIRLDMSEFMEKHSVSRIVGSPPGYVGYDEAGQLTEKVRRRPYSVVLFDEIEKAHPDVLNILLQILDEGKITDAHGRVVSFENTVIVMTSNAGSNVKDSTVGFNRDPQEVARDRVMKALREFLRPEFLGRVDEIVVFRSLTKENYRAIAALLLDEMVQPLADKGIAFAYDDSATAVIAEKSFGDSSGGRAIRRVIRKEIEDKIATLLVEQSANEPTLIKVVGEDGELVIHSA